MSRKIRTMGAPVLAALVLASCNAPPGRGPGAVAEAAGDGPALAAAWPPDGPPRLWSRPLGPGYSGIVTGGGRLYTMYRAGADEVVACLDAATGETAWEYRYRSVPLEGQDPGYGAGPNAAPLLAEGRLYTIGFAGVLNALDAATGGLLWMHDLRAEFGGTVVELGYSASPAAYRDTVIVLVGGPGRGAVAFDASDGRVVWQGLDLEASYASPVVLRLGGEDQLVAFAATEVVGADPGTGDLLWRYPIRNRYPQNICTPIPIGDDGVFVSTGEAGSRGLRVVADGATRVEEAWSNRRVQCFYGTFARVGEVLYGTSGFQSSPRLTAIDANTGDVVWQTRGFRLSHLLAAGGFLILLDDEGTLTLATAEPDGVEVRAAARVLSPPALTPPTIDGTVLYVRDQRVIVALDLGPDPAPAPVPRRSTVRSEDRNGLERTSSRPAHRRKN